MTKSEWWGCPECGEDFLAGAPIDMIEVIETQRCGIVTELDKFNTPVASEKYIDDPPPCLGIKDVRYSCGNCGAELNEDFVVDVMLEREKDVDDD